MGSKYDDAVEDLKISLNFVSVSEKNISKVQQDFV